MAREELTSEELARLGDWEAEHSVDPVHVTVSSGGPPNRRYALWSNVTQPALRSGSAGIEGAGFSIESALTELSASYERVTRND